MTNLVDELRKLAGVRTGYLRPGLFAEAAAEIERLTEERDEMYQRLLGQAESAQRYREAVRVPDEPGKL